MGAGNSCALGESVFFHGVFQASLKRVSIMLAAMALPNGAGCTPPYCFQVREFAEILSATSFARLMDETL